MKQLVCATLALSVAVGMPSMARAEEGKTKEKLTLSLSGAVWGACAGVLSRALVQGKFNIDGSVAPNQGKPQRIVGTVAKDADLGALARAVNGAQTPHRSKTTPAVSLVLTREGLDAKKAKEAAKAIGELKGVDAKGTKAKKGEILVKLTGVAKNEDGKSENVELHLSDVVKPLDDLLGG